MNDTYFLPLGINLGRNVWIIFFEFIWCSRKKQSKANKDIEVDIVGNISNSSKSHTEAT